MVKAKRNTKKARIAVLFVAGAMFFSSIACKDVVGPDGCPTGSHKVMVNNESVCRGDGEGQPMLNGTGQNVQNGVNTLNGTAAKP